MLVPWQGSVNGKYVRSPSRRLATCDLSALHFPAILGALVIAVRPHANAIDGFSLAFGAEA